MQPDSSVQKKGTGNSSAAGSDAGSKKSHHGKIVLYHILVVDMLQDHDHEAEKVEDEVPAGSEAPDSEPPSPIMHEVEMAAIPESETPGRRSKHREEMVVESSLLECAEGMKAVLEFWAAEYLRPKTN
jgi:hypothetical protein